MNLVGARWQRRYAKALQWFIPAELQSTPALLSRAQNIINAVVMAALAGPFFAVFYYTVGYPEGAVAILVGCTPMLCAPFVMRWGRSMRAACELFVTACFCLFVWLAAHMGGITSATAPWMIVPPVVAMLIGGMRSSIFWTTLSCLALVGLYFLPLPPAHLGDAPTLFLFSGIGLIVLVVGFVMLFEMTRTQGFIKLERALNFINELAIRDELTGVHNRRHLLSLIDVEQARNARAPRPFCLCLLDIDFFKRINDTYGHSAGDAVLREFASAVQRQVREADCFGRYGGEEFLLMLPETAVDAAAVLVERIRAAVETLRFADIDPALTMSVSIGVAQYRAGETVAQCIARADEALYLAKARGRNRVVFHGQQASAAQADVRHPPSSMAGVRAQDLAVHEDVRQRDQLTGLPSRAVLRERLAAAVANMPHAGRGGALMLLNVNKFREVNEALGFDGGDAVLVQIAHRVRACLHDADTIVRWNGDELAVVLENLAREADAMLVAEKILAQFGMPLLLEGRDYFVSLSIGIAAFPAATADIDVLLQRADSAMKTAKTWGDNKVQLYPSDAITPASESFALKSHLRSALQNDELFIEYQPLIDLASTRMVGVEALVRWHHPTLGRIEPARFISLAEETGLIVPIGEWVLRTACAQNRAWADAGLPAVSTAVNVSARQLRHPQLIERILAIIADTGIEAARLDLEITEGILIEDIAAIQPGLATLRAAGVKISIDDFGTGYSSLGYLAELPADTVKMDRSFVTRLGDQPGGAGERSYSLARSVVQLAHGLNLKVVAEAVETAGQRDDLLAMQCDVAQGYLFDRPMHPEQIARLLRQQAGNTLKVA